MKEGTLLHMHPAIKNNPMSPAVALAEILASVQEHHANDITSDIQVNSVLLSHQDSSHVPFLTRLSHWMQNLGILSGVGISAALAARFCGVGSVIAKIFPFLSILQFCNPFKFCSNTQSEPDIELGYQTVTTNPSSPPTNPSMSAETPASRNPIAPWTQQIIQQIQGITNE